MLRQGPNPLIGKCLAAIRSLGGSELSHSQTLALIRVPTLAQIFVQTLVQILTLIVTQPPIHFPANFHLPVNVNFPSGLHLSAGTSFGQR